MATRLEKSDPSKLAFRFSTLGATLQAAQDFAVTVDVQFGGMEHARFRKGDGGNIVAPEGAWTPGARFRVVAARAGFADSASVLRAVPEADADHDLGIVIGGFTIGADGHPDPATAWDLDMSVHPGGGGSGGFKVATVAPGEGFETEPQLVEFDPSASAVEQSRHGDADADVRPHHVTAATITVSLRDISGSSRA